MTNEPLEVVDSSGLTDADWAEINRLRQIYTHDGKAEAMSKALAELDASDHIRFMTIMVAIFPDTVREAIKDEMVEPWHDGRRPTGADT